NFVAPASAPPAVDVVPAGTSTEYVVAIGKRPAGSNSTVFVPTQRHWPFGVGVSFTGCTPAASPCEVTATIGWLNVTLSSGAIGTLSEIGAPLPLVGVGVVVVGLPPHDVTTSENSVGHATAFLKRRLRFISSLHDDAIGSAATEGLRHVHLLGLRRRDHEVAGR